MLLLVLGSITSCQQTAVLRQGGQVYQAFTGTAAHSARPLMEDLKDEFCHWLEKRKFRAVEVSQLPAHLGPPVEARVPTESESFFLGTANESEPFLIMVRLQDDQELTLDARVQWYVRSTPEGVQRQKSKVEDFVGDLGMWWAICSRRLEATKK
ncbi:MAG: hypothetical protein ACKVX7_18980 [Planctomycetota bacterium]